MPAPVESIHHAADARARIEALRDAGALFVASHSGGKDSQAMLIRLLEIIPRPQLLVVHAALGEVEWPGALEHAEQQARDADLPFIVARAVKTFLDMVEHRYQVRPGPNSPCWPSASNRQCTSDLKRGPIEREVRRYAKAHGFTTIVSCTGLRAQESPRRAQRPVLRILVGADRRAGNRCPPALVGGDQHAVADHACEALRRFDLSTDNMSVVRVPGDDAPRDHGDPPRPALLG